MSQFIERVIAFRCHDITIWNCACQEKSILQRNNSFLHCTFDFPLKPRRPFNKTVSELCYIITGGTVLCYYISLSDSLPVDTTTRLAAVHSFRDGTAICVYPAMQLYLSYTAWHTDIPIHLVVPYLCSTSAWHGVMKYLISQRL